MLSKKKLDLYIVNPSYCEFLRRYDDKVSYNSGAKSTRPFIGIVLTVNEHIFFAPLSSPKPKHYKMRNAVDFIKIASGKYGVVNFNNMIPVPDDAVTPIVIDAESNPQYRMLLSNQYEWCVNHYASLCQRAQNLYNKYCNGTLDERIAARCCDFVGDTQYVNQWKK